VKAIVAKRGTFVLSHTNLAEYANPSDPKHAEAAERFLERLMPNVYLTDFDLEKAEGFERQPDYAGQPMWPSADLPMLKFVAERSLAAETGLSMMGFVTLSHVYRERLSEVFAESNKNILSALNKQRADSAYVAKARRSVPDATRPKTWVVMGELMRELTIDSNASITVNDIVDWQHAILPVSCCDYVLLDGKWEQRVRALTNRVTQQGLHLTLAKCFSKRDNGLERFLSALEAH
jgi:hypothetical protein